MAAINHKRLAIYDGVSILAICQKSSTKIDLSSSMLLELVDN